MKLRNKQTGEIADGIVTTYEIYVNNLDGLLKKYNSLTELCEEWEDYEPKEHWYIDTRNGNSVVSYVSEPYEADKEIGNIFSSKEEAEKAVEKLKAWKRLKDKGLRIKLRHFGHNATLEANYDVLEGDYLDLVTVFGGEE